MFSTMSWITSPANSATAPPPPNSPAKTTNWSASTSPKKPAGPRSPPQPPASANSRSEPLARDFGDRATAAKLARQDHKLVRFYIPEKARWPKIATTTTGLGQFLTDAVRSVARENPRLSGVVDVTDFNATAAGQRIVDDQHLVNLVQVLNNPDYRLGLNDVDR